MADLLEAALADLLTQPDGTPELAAELREIVEIGIIEPYYEAGEYGFRATGQGLRAVELLHMEVRGHG